MGGDDRALRLSDDYGIPLGKLYGQRGSVIGQSGSGKTNTLKVVAREFRRLGLPVVVIDPMGQFRDLADGVTVILAGRSANADVEIRPDNGAALAQLVAQHRVSIVVDLSLYDPDEEMAVLTAFLPAYWAAVREQESPPPSALIIDEAHLYAPQQGATPISKTIVNGEGEPNPDLDVFRAALRDLMEAPAEAVIGDDGAMAEVVNDLRDQMRSLQAMIDEMTRIVSAKDQEIAALHVELNRWKQVQQALPVSVEEATPTDDEIEARKEKREDQAVLRARRRQERQFETLRIKLRAVLDRQWKRDALTVLIDAGMDEGDEGWLAGDDVMRKIGVSASTWTKFPGQALETLRLIERNKQGGEWYYLADVRELLPGLFPMLDMDAMVQKLREA